MTGKSIVLVAVNGVVVMVVMLYNNKRTTFYKQITSMSCNSGADIIEKEEESKTERTHTKGPTRKGVFSPSNKKGNEPPFVQLKSLGIT